MGIKSAFHIEEMNPRLSIDLNNSTQHAFVPDYSSMNAIFTITDMTFTVDDNLYVDEIELNYEISNQKLYKEVQKELDDFKISPIFSYNNNKTQITGFYIDII